MYSPFRGPVFEAVAKRLADLAAPPHEQICMSLKPLLKHAV
jgi:hypothetical protein